MALNLPDLSEELIILICQSMIPTKHWSHKWVDYEWSGLFCIYDLVRVCKKFQFLKEYSFLLCGGKFHESIEIFHSVNYLGFDNGSEFLRSNGKWNGYIDKFNKLYPNVRGATGAPHPTGNQLTYIINGIQYSCNDKDITDLFGDIYANLNDPEMIDHMTNWPNTQYFMLIRKSFPGISICKDQLEYHVSQLKKGSCAID